MNYKIIFLLSAITTSAYAANVEAQSPRRNQGAACAKTCEQQQAAEAATCRLTFDRCTAQACSSACRGNTSDCAAACTACDYSQAVCLTNSDSRLLACQINCVN